MVADLDILDEFTAVDDNAGTFVAADEGQFGGERPVALDGVEVCVAYAGVLDVDEDFVRAGLLDWDLLVLDCCWWRWSVFVCCRKMLMLTYACRWPRGPAPTAR